jgi:hypothetical protein
MRGATRTLRDAQLCATQGPIFIDELGELVTVLQISERVAYMVVKNVVNRPIERVLSLDNHFCSTYIASSSAFYVPSF